MHVYIEAGLRHCLSNHQEGAIHIFEMGFGTGLNAFLTLLEAEKEKLTVHYTALELEPLSGEESDQLNFPVHLGNEALFKSMHDAPWEEPVALSSSFTLLKQQADLLQYETDQRFHIIYFDAFSPTIQSELWTKEVFTKLFSMLLPEGFLVTYSSKSIVRRAMGEAGFRVEKIQGPYGKREMVRAYRA